MLTSLGRFSGISGFSVGAFKPHLIVLDGFMPEIDGLEVCRRLKSNPETATIKVLMTSAPFGQVVAANQLLLLPPGRYSLLFSATAASGALARAKWQIACLPDEHVIVSVGLDAARPGTRVRAAFDIPAGCGAQRLQLIGTPGDSPQTLDAVIRDLDVVQR